MSSKRQARATPEFLDRIFDIPTSEDDALSKLEKKLSENLDEFLTESKVAGEIPLADLTQKYSNHVIPEEPSFVSEQVDFLLKEVIPYCVHTGSPKFVGHMTSAIPYFLQSLSKCMVALHQNVVKIETSRALTFLERQTISMFHHLIYQEEEPFYQQHTHHRQSTLGLFCSGGTIANIMALWIARNRFMRDVLGDDFDQYGLIDALQKSGHKNCCVFVSQRGHYSLSKAVDILGIGKRQLIPIPVNEDHQMDVIQLQLAHQKAQMEGLHPLAVVAVAGTTETGHIDPLLPIYDFCRRHEIHFHVDAAWGGGVLMSKPSRHLLEGISLADSVVIDGHKQLYLPMGIGMVFFKDPHLAENIQHQTQYIIREGSFDLGRRHLEGSRPGMSLLVHSAMNIIGQQGYQLLIERSIALAKTFAELIEQHEDFEIITAPQLNILTYRFCPKPFKQNASLETLNELNTQLQKRQREQGKSFVSRTRFRHPEPSGQTHSVLRAVLANPLTKEEHLKAVLTEQSEIGHQWIQEQSS